MRGPLVVGEGGAALHFVATCSSAAAIACEGLAGPVQVPSGTPVYPADAIPEDLDVDEVSIAPCEPATDAWVRAWAERRALPWAWVEYGQAAPPDGVAIVAVSAGSTGSGKTALTRRVARALRRSGVSVCVARHPMATLLHTGRFDPRVVRDPRALHDGSIEEREELAPIVGAGVSVVSGLDADRTIELAAREAGPGGVVVWDGGGAAPPWVVPDVHLVAVDALRPLPDATRRRPSDALVVTKADSADDDTLRALERQLRDDRPETPIVLADLSIGVSDGAALRGRAAIVVEDAPSVTLGALGGGAGTVAARRFRCSVVDPRSFAVGAMATTLARFEHLSGVVPAVGRTPDELADLAATVRAMPGEVVLWASNADPAPILVGEERPIIRAFGELTEVAGPSVQELLAPVLPGGQRPFPGPADPTGTT